MCDTSVYSLQTQHAMAQLSEKDFSFELIEVRAAPQYTSHVVHLSHLCPLSPFLPHSFSPSLSLSLPLFLSLPFSPFLSLSLPPFKTPPILFLPPSLPPSLLPVPPSFLPPSLHHPPGTTNLFPEPQLPWSSAHLSAWLEHHLRPPQTPQCTQSVRYTVMTSLLQLKFYVYWSTLHHLQAPRHMSCFRAILRYHVRTRGKCLPQYQRALPRYETTQFSSTNMTAACFFR